MEKCNIYLEDGQCTQITSK